MINKLFKNLKIGNKILLAFGIVILFMMVLGTVMVVTNQNAIQNVYAIECESNLQRMANDAMDEFHSACVYERESYTTIDEEANQSFRQITTETDAMWVELFDYIDQEPVLKNFRADLLDANGSYRQWKSSVETVIAHNTLLEEHRNTIGESGRKLIETSNMMVDSQLLKIVSDWTGEGGSSEELVVSRSDRARQASRMANAITAFCLDIQSMTQSFDLSGADASLALIDQSLQLAEQFKAESTAQEDQQNAQLVMDTIAQYRTAVTEFFSECSGAWDSVHAATALEAAVDRSVFSALEALDEAVVEQVDQTEASARRTMIIIVIIFLASTAVAVLFAIVLIKGITEPVKQIVTAANSIAVGDIDIAVDYNSRDEMGDLVRSFHSMVDGIQMQIHGADLLAQGDFSFDLEPRSEKDSMHLVIRNFVEQINRAFQEIRTSSNQVSSGAEQISQASQNLASGSSEQASTIEEFSAVIVEIKAMAENNTENAAQMLSDVEETSRLVAECKGEMDQMLQAMEQINQKSQSISKVIKVIEDIAFQTNVLALNATVEAARAGQHGKGFAVASDEVRNLASKSAVAAKETANLIGQSSESVSEGNALVSLVNQSIQSMDEIAYKNLQSISKINKASVQQSRAIAEITSGIHEIASVVQANSATAQEMAASSQELSTQAIVLNDTLARFKLKSSITPPVRRPVSAEEYSYATEQGFSLIVNSDKYR